MIHDLDYRSRAKKTVKISFQKKTTICDILLLIETAVQQYGTTVLFGVYINIRIYTKLSGTLRSPISSVELALAA